MQFIHMPLALSCFFLVSCSARSVDVCSPTSALSRPADKNFSNSVHNIIRIDLNNQYWNGVKINNKQILEYLMSIKNKNPRPSILIKYENTTCVKNEKFVSQINKIYRCEQNRNCYSEFSTIPN